MNNGKSIGCSTPSIVAESFPESKVNRNLVGRAEQCDVLTRKTFRCGAFIAARSRRPSINVRKCPRTSGSKQTRCSDRGLPVTAFKKLDAENGTCPVLGVNALKLLTGRKTPPTGPSSACSLRPRAAGTSRSWRPDELRGRSHGWVPARRYLLRPRPQGREARRFAGRAGEQIRAGHQEWRPCILERRDAARPDRDHETGDEQRNCLVCAAAASSSSFGR